jgi:hypothetical protein
MDGRPSNETAVDGKLGQNLGASSSEKPYTNGNSSAKVGEKKPGESGDVLVSTVGRDAFYDPKKESMWTRLGLTAESFKRAPGTTGGQTGQ